MSDVNRMLEAQFDKYFPIYESARELEKEKDIDSALKLYLKILDKYIPMGSAYYDRPAILLEKQKRYDKAIEVCELAIKNQQEYKLHFPIDPYEHRINRLGDKLAKPLNTKITVQESKPKELIPSQETKVQQNIVFPDWYVSISFGSSSSPNFPQALALAKMAPQYIENNVEGRILHQAVYSADPQEYLKFIKLYELISSWKSCFVVINGNLMDRKIIGGLNYCYGDKCRSTNPDFCFGASQLTNNPFGCHRLQISACNNPWWSFGYLDAAKIWHVDKKTILKRIQQFALNYHMCPCFNIERIEMAVASLPDLINPKREKQWTYTGLGVQPKDLFKLTSITINLSNVMEEKEIVDTANNTPGDTGENSLSKDRGLLSAIKSIFRK